MNFAHASLDDSPLVVEYMQPDEVQGRWPGVEPMVQRAMEHSQNDDTTDKILRMIVDGRLMMIVMTRAGEPVACACVEIYERNSGKTCHCMILAGDDMETWVDDWMATWWQIAAGLGCDSLSIKGRPGWAKYAAKRFGFKHEYTIMSLEVKA